MTTAILGFTIATVNDLPLATPSTFMSRGELGLINLNWLQNGKCMGRANSEKYGKMEGLFLKSLFFMQKTTESL